MNETAIHSPHTHSAWRLTAALLRQRGIQLALPLLVADFLTYWISYLVANCRRSLVLSVARQYLPDPLRHWQVNAAVFLLQWSGQTAVWSLELLLFGLAFAMMAVMSRAVNDGNVFGLRSAFRSAGEEVGLPRVIWRSAWRPVSLGYVGMGIPLSYTLLFTTSWWSRVRHVAGLMQALQLGALILASWVIMLVFYRFSLAIPLLMQSQVLIPDALKSSAEVTRGIRWRLILIPAVLIVVSAEMDQLLPGVIARASPEQVSRGVWILINILVSLGTTLLWVAFYTYLAVLAKEYAKPPDAGGTVPADLAPDSAPE